MPADFRRIADRIEKRTSAKEPRQVYARWMKGAWYQLKASKLGPEWETLPPDEQARMDVLPRL